jgi:hypothetical protein
MSARDIEFGLEHLVGKAAVPRANNPSLRGAVRRNNPDGGHASPYYTGLNGTSLTVEVSPVGDLVLNFVSDELDDAITMINAVSPANLQATDDDGFLRLTNLNGGSKNFIRIESGTAAPVLGFVVNPEPGSMSSAGDLESAPPGRGVNTTQSNPQGTALLAADENLTSRSVNRAALGILSHIERIGRELDVEIPGVKEFFPVSVQVHAGSGKKVFFITDPNLRIPLTGFGQSTSDFVSQAGDQFGHLLTTDRRQVVDISQTSPRAAILAAFNNDGSSPTADITQSFTTYGTYDGRSIFGDVTDKLKHVAVPITAIRGNIIQADTATFTARFVQPGDVILIEGATNNSPFNHNGEFIVDAVIDATRIAVRAKRSSDTSFVSTDKPTALNPVLPGGASYGTISILMGNFYTAGFTVMFEVPSWVPDGTYRARILSGYRLRSLPAGALAKFFEPNPDAILAILRNHVILDSVGFRHTAVDVDAPAVAGSPNALTSGTVGSQLAQLLNHLNTLIAGEVAYGGGINWADGTTNPATDLESQVDKILNDLAAVGVDGAAKIRALATGFLGAGSIRTQLNQLDNEWLKLNRNHTISGINNFAADQSSTNATWVYGALQPEDKPNLSFTTIASTGQKRLILQFGDIAFLKIRVYLDDSLNMEITYNAVWSTSTQDWSKDSGGSSNPAILVQFRESGSVLRYRASGAGSWLDNAWTSQSALDLNVVTALMSFIGRLDLGSGVVDTSANANLPRIVTAVAPQATAARTFLWEFGNTSDPAGIKWRLYAGNDGGNGSSREFELVSNAFWNPATGLWNRDITTLNAMSYRFGRNGLRFYHRTTSGGTWNESGWDRIHGLDFLTNQSLRLASSPISSSARFLDLGLGTLSFQGADVATNPSPTTFLTNELRAKNICKGWALLQVGFGATPTIVDGVNITSASYVGSNVLVTIASNMADEDYIVLTTPFNWNLNSDATVVPFNQAAGSFELQATDTSGGPLDLSDVEFGNHLLQFAWFGEQTL